MTAEPSINDADWEAINKVKAMSGIEDTTGYSTPFNVLRWIYAYEFDLNEATRRYKRHLNMRKILGLDDILETPSEHTNIDDDADNYAPLTIMGKPVSDSDNRVLIIERTGMFDLNKMMASMKTTTFIMNRFRKMEIMLREVMRIEKETGKMSGCVLLFDMKGLKFHANLISILTGPYRIMWGTLIEQYPHFYTKMVVINAPKFINVIFTACAAFVPTEYKTRMNILGDNWREEILKHIDADSLPECYGGTIPDPKGCPLCSTIVPIPDSTNLAKLLEMKDEKALIGLMNEYTIPAGGILTLTYKLEEGDIIEFYIYQTQEFTFDCVFTESIVKIDKKDHLKVYPEAHMGCERPGMASIDVFKWKAQKSGYYHFVYGNEKSWFFNVKFELKSYVTTTEGLVFDTHGTQNCNYDYNVPGCGIRGANNKQCLENEFNCPLSETCVSLAQRCDGEYNCLNEEDEQNCIMCGRNEFQCVVSEQCIPDSLRCNGVRDCLDGTDEMFCEMCGRGHFYCKKSNQCVRNELRCNGVNDCTLAEDEYNCKKDKKFSQPYLCEDKIHTIEYKFVCDNKYDCEDGSDEKYCSSTSEIEDNYVFSSRPAVLEEIGDQLFTRQPMMSLAQMPYNSFTTNSYVPEPINNYESTAIYETTRRPSRKPKRIRTTAMTTTMPPTTTMVEEEMYEESEEVEEETEQPEESWSTKFNNVMNNLDTFTTRYYIIMADISAPKLVQPVQVYGRKKNAVAVAFARQGKAQVRVNGRPLDQVQPEGLRMKLQEPLLVVGEDKFAGINIKINVRGGGHVSQIYAIRQAMAKSLVSFYQKNVDEQAKNELKQSFVDYDKTLLTSDNRRCETKKAGGKSARARYQKSYR
uniref:CRAL-TRIO domain-containing protein n=1 Tax=Rhabditophanes sp. KR3021 TaxID=114890 RepID=A0AC35TN65_9BILA